LVAGLGSSLVAALGVVPETRSFELTPLHPSVYKEAWA
jgi:hypothetical protein